MKKIITKILIVLSAIILLTSCTKAPFLDKDPLGEYSEVAVWKDPALIEPFVNTIYAGTLGSPFNYMRLACYTDEAVNALYGNAFNVNKSLITSDSYLEWEFGFGSDHTAHFTWNRLYANVRRTNLFFANIDRAESDDPAWIPRLKGEVYFNRAFTYHHLVSLYGGVPIITKAHELNDDFSAPRNTYEECINFIAGQLDSAAALLPDTYPAAQLGRATKGAALALKARVLLYAASDLHNPEKNGSVVAGYSNPELLGYTGGDATARWQAAKAAAKAVIDLNRYSLYKPDPATPAEAEQNLTAYFISTNGTEEDILLQYISLLGYDDYPALRVAPNGYNGHGSTTPVGEMVDDYEMSDGTKFDWNNPVHAADPYANREARLYSSILYEGAQWRERPADVRAIDPFGKIQVGLVVNTSGQTVKGGLDNREGPINTSNGGYTGYYLRKAVDISYDPTFGSAMQNVPFRHLRYGEVLLNYAEACVETGEDAEARTYINMIRKRAGLPDLDGSLAGDALRQACRHERRVELAFEDIRFWDVRRWLIGPQQLTRTMHKADVKYVTNATVTAYRKPDGTTWGPAIITNQENGVDVRIFNNEDYFFPLMRTEINKNNLLIQNPGY
ncbi:RagB/SusD family nutrient uptake outer membrane protein [Agriterribacter humi]|uniref:RagB/SusD family nutrient uptake outer membrane protein n=1 Tax=Agriterribacter humi TaxID=1104781 RepID=UPI0012656A85|nr:RagB/SusD family nutrient uptake outer membrane protein [Agriterribacter humi]